MECTAYDLGGDVLDIQTTTTYDADGNVVSVVIEQHVTNDLADDDGADASLVLGLAVQISGLCPAAARTGFSDDFCVPAMSAIFRGE